MKDLRHFVLIYLIGFSLLLSCSSDDAGDPNEQGGSPVEEIDIPAAPASVSLQEAVFYSIDLNDLSGDSFKVRVFVDGLTDANAIFQFAATAPGTYLSLIHI